MMNKLRDTISEAMDNLIVSLQGTDDVDVADHVDALYDKLSLPTSKDSAMYREENEYPIALITPLNYMYKQWINDFGISGQRYVMVNSVKRVDGRYFSAIQPGLMAWEVDLDVVAFASDRVRPFTPPAAQPVSVSEEIKKRADLFVFGLGDIDEKEFAKTCFISGFKSALSYQPTKIDEGEIINIFEDYSEDETKVHEMAVDESKWMKAAKAIAKLINKQEDKQ